MHGEKKTKMLAISFFCIREENWKEVTGKTTVDDMTAVLHKTLDKYPAHCFTWKKVRRKPNSSPITDGSTVK